jgi:hypothetical protein
MSNLARTTICLGLLALAAPFHAALAQSIGSVGAVNQDAKGTPPGGAARTISLGHGIVQRERIVTNAEGTAQISFTDKSAMSIGRNSNVVIDRYVYDPSTGVGQQAASLAKGAMRFVGGQVSHETGATVATPSATIGVRGGVASISLEGGSRLRVVNHYGVTTVQNGAGRFVISRPDFQVFVDGPNSAPRAGGMVDAAYLADLGRSLTSRGNQKGGAKSPPTNDMLRDVVTPRPAAPTPDLDIAFQGDQVVRAKGSPTRLEREVFVEPVVTPVVTPVVVPVVVPVVTPIIPTNPLLPGGR